MTRIYSYINQQWAGGGRIATLSLSTVITWLWLLGIASCPLLVYGSGTPVSQLEAWLSDSHLSSTVREAFHARITTNPQAYEWLVAKDQQVYALVYQPQTVAISSSSQILQFKRNQAQARALHLLLIYAAGEHYQQLGFNNREAIAKSLAMLSTTTRGQLRPGLQSRSAVLDAGVVALTWIEEQRIISYRQQPPSLEEFLPAYCRALYPTAQALFLEHQHRQALGIYLEMHHLHCRQPTAYFLDAAECFLAIHQPQDAKRMASYLFNAQAAKLSSSEAERTGDIFFAVGDEITAKKAYELALSRLHAGL